MIDQNLLEVGSVEEKTLFEGEKKLMEIIWQEEPLESGRLVKIAGKELDWRKSTTYTVLRRLIDKGFVRNEDSIVSSLISKKDVLISESNQVVEESFSGSLPKFVAAFLGNEKTLSDEEAEALIKLVKDHMG